MITKLHKMRYRISWVAHLFMKIIYQNFKKIHNVYKELKHLFLTYFNWSSCYELKLKVNGNVLFMTKKS